MATTAPQPMDLRYFNKPVRVSGGILRLKGQLDFSHLMQSDGQIFGGNNIENKSFFCCLFLDLLAPVGLEDMYKISQLAEEYDDVSFVCISMESPDVLNTLHQSLALTDNTILLSAKDTQFGDDMGLKIISPSELNGLLVPVILLIEGDTIQNIVRIQELSEGLRIGIDELEENYFPDKKSTNIRRP